MMKASKNIIRFIAHCEGVRLKAYDDVAGHSTIGYGHLNKDHLKSITLEQAKELLEADIMVFVEGLNTLLKGITISQEHFDALLSFTFNLGLGAFKKSTMFRYLKEGRIGESIWEIPKFSNVKDPSTGSLMPSSGLQIRRYAEVIIALGIAGKPERLRHLIQLKPRTMNGVIEKLNYYLLEKYTV